MKSSRLIGIIKKVNSQIWKIKNDDKPKDSKTDSLGLFFQLAFAINIYLYVLIFKITKLINITTV